MSICRHRFRASALAVLLGAAILSAAAADPPPQPHPCRELTGAERTKCEQQVREANPPRPAPPPPAADEHEPPPPDITSEGDERSDTADPPQA
jgi:hypothetical protein